MVVIVPVLQLSLLQLWLLVRQQWLRKTLDDAHDVGMTCYVPNQACPVRCTHLCSCAHGVEERRQLPPCFRVRLRLNMKVLKAHLHPGQLKVHPGHEGTQHTYSGPLLLHLPAKELAIHGPPLDNLQLHQHGP